MKIKNITTILLSGMFILSMSVWCFFGTTPDYSESERRVLEKFPEISAQSIMSGDFAEDFEDYAVDRFPMRDNFRSLKAYSRLYAFMQKDNNGLYTADGHLSKLIYPENYNMADYATDLFAKVRDSYFSDNKVYLAVIPDKNIYLAEANGYLSIDYQEFSEYVQNKMPYARYIEIADLLSADDYYFTDTHWRQNRITDVAARLAYKMGESLEGSYTENVLEYPFNGVYVGQSALKVKPDTITYLTNDIINSLEVEGAKAVYDMTKAESKDPYEMFLSGNQPVVKVTNPGNPYGKRLIMFRDSFASSLTPIMAEAYSEIVLVDLRYISSTLLEQFVGFENADVLFIYSTMLLNDSMSMK